MTFSKGEFIEQKEIVTEEKPEKNDEIIFVISLCQQLFDRMIVIEVISSTIGFHCSTALDK